MITDGEFGEMTRARVLLVGEVERFGQSRSVKREAGRLVSNLRTSQALIWMWLAFCLVQAGCAGKSSGPDQKVVNVVLVEAVKILKKDVNQIDVAKPLMAQGADELDMIELVMAVEDALKVEIPDSALGDNVPEAQKTLSIEKLAEIVSGRLKSQSTGKAGHSHSNF